MKDEKTTDKKYELINFACGGSIRAIAGQANPRQKMLTFILGSKKLSRPTYAGEPCNCLNGCPCTVKESGREQTRGWYTESETEKPNDSHLTWAVRCRIIRIDPIEGGAE